MDKKFLEEYQSKEEEKIQEYQKKIVSGEIDVNIKYPEYERFTKIVEPVVKPELFSYELDKEKIWSQIPFSGTLAIPLFSISEKNFLNRHGFEISDVDKLVELAKETGRVQFVLTTYAQNYENLEFLDPIFQELRPPLIPSIPYEKYANKKTIEKWEIEFRTLAAIAYVPWLENTINALGENENFLQDYLNRRSGTYVRIKILYPEITETIENALIDNPIYAHCLLTQYTHSTGQFFEPLCDSYNSSLSYMKFYGLDQTQDMSDHVTFPIDIGRYLMKKIVLHPTSYQACQEVILHYQQNDLYKTLESLSNAVKNNSKDKTVENINELETILDNAWKDAKKIEGRKELIQDGISVVLGGLGGLASLALGSNPMGLLAGLGFKIADKKLETKGKSTSEKLAKLTSKEYLVNIFDFQNKHKLQN